MIKQLISAMRPLRAARRVLFVACLMLSAFSLGASAQTAQTQTGIDPEKAQSIRRLLQQVKAGDLGVQMIEQMLPQVRPLFNQLPPGVRDRVLQEFETALRADFTADKMIESAIPIYDKHFTHEEIKGLIAFYGTPLGAKVISSMPQVARESYEEGARRGQETAARIVRKLQDEGLFETSVIAPVPAPAPRSAPKSRRSTRRP